MITLRGTEYRTSYNWEAIEGVQSDLNEDSLDKLYLTIAKVVGDKKGVTSKDMTNVMKIAKVVVYHGIRGACLEDDKPCPFKSPANVGAHLSSFHDAGKEIGLFLASMYALFHADPDEQTGEANREAQPN